MVEIKIVIIRSDQSFLNFMVQVSSRQRSQYSKTDETEIQVKAVFPQIRKVFSDKFGPNNKNGSMNFDHLTHNRQ